MLPSSLMNKGIFSSARLQNTILSFISKKCIVLSLKICKGKEYLPKRGYYYFPIPEAEKGETPRLFPVGVRAGRGQAAVSDGNGKLKL